MKDEQFAAMFLLYEELTRKEIESYCTSNPRCVNGYEFAKELIAPEATKRTFIMIYGKDIWEDFRNTFNERQKELEQSKEKTT